MSAFMCSTTHVRVLVTAATCQRYPNLPMLPRDSFASEPEAFARLRDYAEREKYQDGHNFPLKAGFEDELGRGLMLSNVASLRALYPRESWAAELDEARAFRFALTQRPAVEVLKAIDCYEHQACEVADWANTWAAEVCKRLRASEITRLPGYEGAPWGIDDPDGGPLEPGSAGAPVSLFSLVPKGTR